MTSEEKKILELPAAFFLDTNVLDPLPETLESGSLNSLILEVKQVSSKVFLPDVVAREWIQHRINSLVKSYDNVRKGYKHLKGYMSDTPDFELEFTKIADAVFKNGIQRIRNSGLLIRRPPYINTRSITTNAVTGIAPFAHSNKGFKDELVVLSMLELINKRAYKSCVLVTKDGDFRQNEILSRFKPFEVDFRVVTNLQQATQLIVDTLNEAGQKYHEQVLRNATEYAIAHQGEISAHIAKKIELDGVSEYRISAGEKYSALNGTLKRVVEVKQVEVQGAIPGIADESTGLTPITIAANVDLELEYEQMEFDWTDFLGKKIKTIEDKKEFRPLPYKRVTIAKTITASVEAKAKRVNGKWEDFEITEVSI